jgi:hypothetical protein
VKEAIVSRQPVCLVLSLSFFFSLHFYISLGRSERPVFVFPRSVFIAAAASACDPETKADPHGSRAVRVA